MPIVKGIALVTGSAQGIGRGIALRLANDGYDIALNDVSSKRDELRTVAVDIEKLGRKALLVPADVSVEEEVKEMVQEVVKELGGLDVMVANAGIARVATLVNTELADWEQIMAVNARGAFLCYKYAAQQMILQGRGGRIIGASSIQGLRGPPFHAAYCASKFAIRGLTHSAAQELGRYNITVNSYAPGTIITEMSQSNDQKVRRLVEDGSSVLNQSGAVKSDSELAKSLLNGSETRPIRDDGQPEDIAALVSYLASKEARFVTGQTFAVDGGVVLT